VTDLLPSTVIRRTALDTFTAFVWKHSSALVLDDFNILIVSTFDVYHILPYHTTFFIPVSIPVRVPRHLGIYLSDFQIL